MPMLVGILAGQNDGKHQVDKNNISYNDCFEKKKQIWNSMVFCLRLKKTYTVDFQLIQQALSLMTNPTVLAAKGTMFICFQLIDVTIISFIVTSLPRCEIDTLNQNLFAHLGWYQFTVSQEGNRPIGLTSLAFPKDYHTHVVQKGFL